LQISPSAGWARTSRWACGARPSSVSTRSQASGGASRGNVQTRKCRIIRVIDENGKRLQGAITRDPTRRWREFEVFCEHSAVNKEEMMRIERCVRADQGQELVDWLTKHM